MNNKPDLDNKDSIFFKSWYSSTNWAFALKICLLLFILLIFVYSIWHGLRLKLSSFLFVALGTTLVFLLFMLLFAFERRESRKLASFLSMMTDTSGACYWELENPSQKMRIIPDSHYLFGNDIRYAEDFKAILHPEDSAEFTKALENLKTSEEHLQTAVRLRNSLGEWRWYMIKSSLSDRKDGKLTKIMGSMFDIDDYRQAIDAISASEKRFGVIFQNAPGGMAVTDPRSIILEANPAFYDILGYAPGELEGSSILALSEHFRSTATLAEVCQNGHSHRKETFTRKNGEKILLDFGLSVLHDEEGNISSYIFSGIDVSQQHRYAEELRLLSEKRHIHNAHLETLHSLIHTLLQTRNRDHLLEGMLGYLKNTILSSSCAVYLSTWRKDSEDFSLKRLAWYDEEGIPVPSSSSVQTAIIHQRPLVEPERDLVKTRAISPIIFQTHTLGAVDIYKPSGLSSTDLKIFQLLVDYVAGFWILYDLLALREEEASIDALTGIWNRRSIINQLNNESDRISRYGGNACVAIADMGNFKYINDNYGHPKGDEVLRKVAAVLKDNLRTSDSVGRYGGDEFILLLPNVTPEAAWFVIERLRDKVSQLKIHTDDTDDCSSFIPVVIDFGAALFPGKAESLLDTIKLADEDMYARKIARKEQNKRADSQSI